MIFMTPPKGDNLGVKRIKLMYFFKNLIHSRAWARQTKYIVIMTKKGSTKVVNFLIPGAGSVVLGHGNTSHIVKMHLVISLQIFFSPPRYESTRIVLLLMGNMEYISLVRQVLFIFSKRRYIYHCNSIIIAL